MYRPILSLGILLTEDASSPRISVLSSATAYKCAASARFFFFLFAHVSNRLPCIRDEFATMISRRTFHLCISFALSRAHKQRSTDGVSRKTVFLPHAYSRCYQRTEIVDIRRMRFNRRRVCGSRFLRSFVSVIGR